MRKVLLLALFVLAGSALALDYQTALSLSNERPTVISARLKFQDASDQLNRVSSDPLALRLDRLKASQEKELAEAELRLATISACSEISSAYTHVLDAESQVALAEKALELAEKGLQIARLRFEKGGASRQDVVAAEISLQDARNRLEAAKNGAQLARSQLVSLLGVEAGTDSLQPTPTIETPDWEEVLKSLEKHPDWLKAHHAAALAATALDLLDPSYASPAQLENARVNSERAAKGAVEAERGLKLRTERLWNSVADKRQTAGLAGEKLRKANEDLSIARKRFEAGLISEIALMQAELQQSQAQLENDAAQHALLAANWALFEATSWLPEICHAR